MSARGLAALETLERLGHHDLLDAPDTHSRHSSPEPVLSERLYEQGLGGRRLQVFRALHRRELEALLASLKGGLDAQDRAARGRVRRLLGLEGAREDLASVAATRPEAAAWLGELDADLRPDRAAGVLRRARRPGDPWARMWEGQALIRAARAREARAPLEEAGPLFSKPPHVYWLLLAQARLHARRFGEAREALDRAESLDAGSPAVPSMRGHLAHRAGDREEALSRFHEARDLDLDVAGSYLFEGLGLDLTWDAPRRYLEALDRAIARHPGNAVLHAERAELRRDPRFCLYREAFLDYEQAARAAPRAAWIRAVLARARNNADGGRAGLAEFDGAVALCPRSGWMRAWRGAALSRVGETRPAMADFGRAQALMPWYPFTYAWRGAALVRAARWDEARADLDRAVELDSSYLFSRFERFRARRGQGDWDGAAADLNVCFAADPKYTWLGRDGGKALRLLAAAARRRPKLGWLRAWLSQARLQTGDPRRGIDDARAAVRMLPRELQPRVWLAQALAACGDAVRARRGYEACLRRNPGLWAAHEGLASLHAAAGRWELAYRHRVLAARLAPTTVALQVSAAEAAMRLGRGAAALAHLRRALELDHGSREAALLAAELRLRRGELRAAQAHLDAIFRAPQPPARAYAMRGTLRQRQGDGAGAVEDFRRAYALDPSVFPPEARDAVKRLAGGEQ